MNSGSYVNGLPFIATKERKNFISNPCDTERPYSKIRRRKQFPLGLVRDVGNVLNIIVATGSRETRAVKVLSTWFREYCSTFDLENEKHQQSIRMKELHTIEVCGWIRRICRKIRLDRREMLVAETSALLHDLGRFEQCRSYGTFWDKHSFNHAEMSALTIREYGLLRDLSAEESTIVLTAVGLHNVFLVPESVAGRQRFFLHLLRDADKLDILRIFSEWYRQSEERRIHIAGLELTKSAECSPLILRDLREGRISNRDYVRTTTDHLLLKLSFLYDIQFDATLEILAGEGFIDDIVAALPENPTVAAVVKAVQLDFIERKGLDLFKTPTRRAYGPAFFRAFPRLSRYLKTSFA